IVPLALMVMLLGACTSMTGGTAGENADDAQITAAVKTKLAVDRLGSLTRVAMETNLRTVYLTGVVESEEARERAAALAGSVTHVNGVVTHLSVRQKG